MPKFMVTVAKDATVYYPMLVEAESLEEVKAHCGKHGYRGPVISSHEPHHVSFDNVEGYSICDETGEEVFAK